MFLTPPLELTSYAGRIAANKLTIIQLFNNYSPTFMHIRYLKVGFQVKLPATIILQLITDHSTTARSKTTMQKYFLGPSPLPG